MKIIIVLVAIISVVCGIQYDGLRVKFSWSDAFVDLEYFYHVPRTLIQAELEGWRRLDRDDDYLPELRLYCIMQNKGVCGLYDVAGFVTGLQISVPKDLYEPPPFLKPEHRFKSWTVRADDNDGENSREYWTVSQYFVSPESLNAGAGPTMENGATLQDGGVWVRDLHDKIMKIPTEEEDLPNANFLKQNCMANMGIHYYYNMSREMKCEDYHPFFLLATEGQLVGVGFQYFGRVPINPWIEWMEPVDDPSPFIKDIMPDSPPCVLEWGKTYGLLSLHVYYIDKPWLIRCKDGDSASPSSPQDRLAMTIMRYIDIINDEILKFLYA